MCVVRGFYSGSFLILKVVYGFVAVKSVQVDDIRVNIRGGNEAQHSEDGPSVARTCPFISPSNFQPVKVYSYFSVAIPTLAEAV